MKVLEVTLIKENFKSYNYIYNLELTAKINTGMWCRITDISRIINQKQLIKTVYIYALNKGLRECSCVKVSMLLS
jgi:hypothetical protein